MLLFILFFGFLLVAGIFNYLEGREDARRREAVYRENAKRLEEIRAELNRKRAEEEERRDEARRCKDAFSEPSARAMWNV